MNSKPTDFQPIGFFQRFFFGQSQDLSVVFWLVFCTFIAICFRQRNILKVGRFSQGKPAYFSSRGHFFLNLIALGPCEYLSLSSYMVIENTMVVYDRALRRINWYSYPEFEFLKDEEIDYHFQDFIFLNEIGHVFAISDDLLD